jgi:CRP/FNR family transcriptional regulator
MSDLQKNISSSKEIAACLSCPAKSACFEKLTRDELQKVSDNKVHLHFKKSETIAKQGAFITHMLYLRKGLVKVYNEVDYRSNLIYSVHRTGKMLGLASLFGGAHFQYSIAALEDSYVCAIDRKVMEELIKDNGLFASQVLQSVNADLLLTREKMVSLTMKQLNGRMADVLLYLADKVYQEDAFPLALSRKDLAEMSGMSTMSVVRTLQEFQKEKFISNSNHQVVIHNKQALQEMSHTG